MRSASTPDAGRDLAASPARGTGSDDYFELEEGAARRGSAAAASTAAASSVGATASLSGNNSEASTFLSLGSPPPASTMSARSGAGSSRVSQYFHRNQTVEVLPRQPASASASFLSERPSSELFRTLTSSQLLNFRQRLLDDDSDRVYTRTDFARGLNPQPNAPTAASAANMLPRTSSWRLFYRNLPRTLRFRQNTRSTTRYIDPANAASLRSRLRARRAEEDARVDFADTMSPVPSGRALTDFEREMLIRAPNAGTAPGSDAAASAMGARKLTSKASSHGMMGHHRTDSVFSIESNSLGDRKKYKIVKINDGGNFAVRPSVDAANARANSTATTNAAGGEGGENEEPEEFFVSNEVTTSQYTWWSFVPVFLYLTFQKTANLYFLLIAIFQMIPSVSPTNGVPLQFIPLAIVTVIDAAFAGYEDYKRHVADNLANSARTRVFNRQLREFEEVEWREVKVGDFVKVKNHEMLPTDVLVLSVIPAEGSRTGGNTGLCYVETKNLDGETNLKVREAPLATLSMFANEDEAGDMVQGFVESELPNGDINSYSGTLFLEETPDPIPISLKNMLMRGSKLRNTSFIYGLVVNTGVDTKIMMSSGDEFPVKVSSIDEMTNRQVIFVVILLVIMSLIGASADHIWMKNIKFPTHFSISGLDTGFITTFVYFFATLASMVPITLYVSITLVKALQGYFMEKDLDMYDPETDTPVSVRNMQLNEQLGQISHIFSDKTGTLTCNKMEFRKCSVNGVSYGKGTTAIGLAARMRSDFKGDPIAEDEDEEGEEVDTHTPVANVNFKDKTLWRDLESREEEQSKKIEEFFTHLALCHGVLIERPESDQADDSEKEAAAAGDVQYSASSPDEQALVSGAKFFGFEFVDREPGSLSMKTPSGVVEQYDVLEVFEFDSTRKRMSVIVQRRKRDDELMKMENSDEGEVLVLTKGADSMLFPRLKLSSTNNERIRGDTEKHLESFARDGLRTLVICSKKLSLTEWESFHARYRTVSADLQQVEAKSRGESNMIDMLQDEMETDLELLGTTAIEDRLQDGVPETMEQLGKAGICIWVLTGDMEETAINIGYACRLLNNDMQRHVINSAKYKTKGAVLRHLDKVFHSIHESLYPSSSDTDGSASATAAQSVVSPPKYQEEHALVIDGASLNTILEDPLYNLHLLRVALLCKVVVACRVSPQQKAQLVELVKLNVPDSHTLSIGDGANDVPMIQSAHIGVGISGQEGMQAVNSSDYALGQFRFLSPLVLVHGRWNYNRVTALVVYTFYKNIVYNVAMFWYMLWPTAWSGTMSYTALIQQGYNLLFTSLPIIAYSAYDKDLPKKVVLQYPALYHAATRAHSFFSYQMFWKWIVLGVIDSVGVFYATLAIAWNIMRLGTSLEYTVLESVGWTVLCMVVNARFCLMVNSWDSLEYGAMAIMIVLLYLVQYAVDQISMLDYYATYTFPWAFGRPQFWLGQLFAIVAILCKDFLYEGVCKRFFPTYLDLVKESFSTKGASTISQEELAEYKPPQNQYLRPELAALIDYQDRRVREQTPTARRSTGTGSRRASHHGFAFDKPAHVVNWILQRNGPNSRRNSINTEVRQTILHSDDPVIFENQRYQPFCGFGSTYPGYLLPTDRMRWSDRSGKISAMVIPLAGLEVNLDVPGCDPDGWVYENDFKFFPSTPPVDEEEDEEDEESEADLSSTGRLSRKEEKRKEKERKKKEKEKKRRAKNSRKKLRGHHGLVRRREWRLTEEFRETLAERERQRESEMSHDSSSGFVDENGTPVGAISGLDE